tara:strand:- start:182 stop:610 length:429 start_codon:yes stop_codon:yes gene_type:complete
MNKFFRNISIFTLVLIMGCSKKSPAVTVNIYDSEEYKSLDRKDLMVGESIWSTACFRCHMYGTNGAVLLDDKAYWDKAASKGIDELYKSVWEGKKVENGQMPAKGFCNLCSEDEIRKSVFYIFNLGKRVQASNEEKALKEEG